MDYRAFTEHKVNHPNLFNFKQNSELWHSCHLSTEHGMEYSLISKGILCDSSDHEC